MAPLLMRFPNAFDAREAPFFAEFATDCRRICEETYTPAAMQSAEELCTLAGFCGVVPVRRDMVLYQNQKYMAENPLYTDAAYAKAAGRGDLAVMPGFAACDECFMAPVPAGARDLLLVSGLNHSLEQLRPLAVGDTLYLVADERHFTDLTPAQGAPWRSIAITTKGSIYNAQREKVMRVTFRVTENLGTFRAGCRPASFAEWLAPDWTSREDHFYSDDDWARIRAIWQQERVRGKTPRFFEDVALGEEPPATLEGPVDDCLEPIAPWGMGLGGSRSLKREILDAACFSAMHRNPYDGIWRMGKRSYAYPPFPDGGGDLKYSPEFGGGQTSFSESDAPESLPPERFVFINFMGRDWAARHVLDYIGDSGRLKSLSWGIMPPECLAHYGFSVPQNPEAVRFLDAIPEKRGRCLHHGLERDVALTRSRVTEKRIENGEGIVRLIWWTETITGEIYEEGAAEVVLPRRTLDAAGEKGYTEAQITKKA